MLLENLVATQDLEIANELRKISLSSQWSVVDYFDKGIHTNRPRTTDVKSRLHPVVRIQRGEAFGVGAELVAYPEVTVERLLPERADGFEPTRCRDDGPR